MRYFYPKGNVYNRFPETVRDEKEFKSALRVSNLPNEKPKQERISFLQSIRQSLSSK